MIGVFVAMSILAATLIMFSFVYRKETGRNFLKDIFNDMLGKSRSN